MFLNKVKNPFSSHFVTALTILSLLSFMVFPPMYLVGLLMMLLFTRWMIPVKILLSLPLIIYIVLVVVLNSQLYTLKYYPLCLPLPPYLTHTTGAGFVSTISEPRAICMYERAIKGDDVGFCQKTGFHLQSDKECYQKILQKYQYNNPDVCMNPTSESNEQYREHSRLDCLIEFVSKNYTQDWCSLYKDKIPHRTISMCYSTAAVHHKNEILCKNISDSDGIMYCLSNVAVAKSSPEICDLAKTYGKGISLAQINDCKEKSRR